MPTPAFASAVVLLAFGVVSCASDGGSSSGTWRERHGTHSTVAVFEGLALATLPAHGIRVQASHDSSAGAGARTESGGAGGAGEAGGGDVGHAGASTSGGGQGPAPVEGLRSASTPPPAWQVFDAAAVAAVGGQLCDVQGHFPNTSGEGNTSFRWGILYGVPLQNARSLVRNSQAYTVGGFIGYRTYRVRAGDRYYLGGPVWYPLDRVPGNPGGFTAGAP